MKIINQNILDITRGVIFHQVNCEGHMGGGLARALADKYRHLELEYRHFCNLYGDHLNYTLLGKVQLVIVSADLYVCNVFGQISTSSAQRETSYDGTVKAFEQIVADREKFTDTSAFYTLPLYFPYKMGCGLGGGNWQIYSAIIEAYFPDAIICKHE